MKPATHPFSLHVFLPDGDPEGIRVITKDNWIGLGVHFPRVLFPESRKRPELQQPGIYVLVSPGEHTQLPRVYIGESDKLRPRLEQHLHTKDFWTHAVAFTAPSLNQAHAKHLESSLVKLATAAKRCELENGNAPNPPFLPPGDVAQADAFLADMLLCLPLLGMAYFEPPGLGGAAALGDELSLKHKDIDAQGIDSPQGFVVRKGSRAVKLAVASAPPKLVGLRQHLLVEGVLREEDQALVFAQDYTFDSPSAAAEVIIGGTASGPRVWKAPDGRTLKELQDAAVGIP